MIKRERPNTEDRAYLLPLLIVAVCALVGLLANCSAARAQTARANADPFAFAQRMAGGSAPACNDRQSVVQQLRENFGETPRGVGLTGDGRVIELFASDQGSWTLLISLPNGQTCMMASGHGWESMEPRKGRDARHRTAQDGRWERPET